MNNGEQQRAEFLGSNSIGSDHFGSDNICNNFGSSSDADRDAVESSFSSSYGSSDFSHKSKVRSSVIRPARPDLSKLQFVNRHNERLVKFPGDISGFDFAIQRLSGCDVLLLDHSTQVMADEIERCRLVIGPIDGSVFLRGVRHSTVFVACRQFRCRDCEDVDVYLYCATKSPVIESSSAMRFHEWSVEYEALAEQFRRAKLDPLVNHWDIIFDFTARSDGQLNYSIVREPTPLRLSDTGIELSHALDQKQSDDASTLFGVGLNLGSTGADEVAEQESSRGSTIVSLVGSADADAPMESYGSADCFGDEPTNSYAMESYGSADCFGDKPTNSYGSANLLDNDNDSQGSKSKTYSSPPNCDICQEWPAEVLCDDCGFNFCVRGLCDPEIHVDEKLAHRRTPLT